MCKGGEVTVDELEDRTDVIMLSLVAIKIQSKKFKWGIPRTFSHAEERPVKQKRARAMTYFGAFYHSDAIRIGKL